MLKRKIISCLLVFCLIAGLYVTPAIAYTTDDSPQTATSLDTQITEESINQGLEDSLDSSNSGDSGAVSGNSSTEGNDATGGNNDEGSSSEEENIEQDGEVVYSIQPVGKPQPSTGTASGSYGTGSQYPLVPLSLERSSLSAGADKEVTIDINKNVDIVIDNNAIAKTGNTDASGTQLENDVSGTAKSTALDKYGREIESTKGGAIADNSVIKSIDNSGTATAASSLAKADNTMDNNTATVSPDTTVTVDVLGKVINSNVVVKVLYNYWAAITGLAEAITGNSKADGLIADNSIHSDDQALAKGDASPSQSGGAYDGSALAFNDADNTIKNKGSAAALTGEANAKNEMQGNDISIAPIIGTIIELCGDIVNSNVTIELVYNFLAAISGQATAKTGDANAVGAGVNNEINNYSDAKAVGDAPSSSISGYSDGSALVVNDTRNSIANTGDGIAVSGNAEALNEMTNNNVTVAPVISSLVGILDDIIDSNVLIRITYNFWAIISGEANAQTGNTDATGLDADNSINNSSVATAAGDAARPTLSSVKGGTPTNGEGVAINGTDNSIDNIGGALSASGDAKASNTMTDNTINLSPIIDTVVMLVRPIVSEGLMIIEIVYDIWGTLTGAANATTGDASSKGAVAVNSIDSHSDATALAKVTLRGSDGSAMAYNSSDNDIGNDGLGVAMTGNADAKSVMSEAEVAISAYLREDLIVDGYGNNSRNNAVGADVSEISDAKSGDALAIGSDALSEMKSTASSKDVFGGGGHTINESDDDIFSMGTAVAITGAANAASGKPSPGNTENKVIIGTDLGGGQPKAANSPQVASTSNPDNEDTEESIALAYVDGDNGSSNDGNTDTTGNTVTMTAAGLEKGNDNEGNGSTSLGDTSQAAGSNTGSSYASAREAIDGISKENPILSERVSFRELAADADKGFKLISRTDRNYVDNTMFGGTSSDGSQSGNAPWWVWILVSGLFAGWIKLALRVKPWNRQDL